MKVFGKSLSEYVGFSKWILGLITVVGVGRLVLSLAGLPNSEVKWLSITGAGLTGIVYFAVRVPTAGFGGYKHLLPLLVLQAAVANGIVISAILIAMATGVDNIFSAPEYSGGLDGKTWAHAGAHLGFGIVLGPLIAWLVAAGLMFVVKKLTPAPAAANS